MRRARKLQTLTVYLLCGVLALPSHRATAGNCSNPQKECLEGPGTKEFFGESFTRDCWKYRVTYSCPSDEIISDCAQLREQGCEQLGVTCVDSDPSGTCNAYELKYRCQTEPGSEQEVTRCDKQAFCSTDSAGCFDTSSPTDEDLGETAVIMELARQAGVYGPNPDGSMSFFGGDSEQCSVKIIGGESAKLQNCCYAASGGDALSNYMILGAGLTAGGTVAREAIRVGSKYVYDTLFQKTSSGLLAKGVGAINHWAGGLEGAAFQPSFNFFGVSFNFSFANGFQVTAFNPVVFSAQIAAMMLIKWLSCSADEKELSLKMGQGLCVQYEQHCSARVPPGIGVCVQRTKQYCCFNSKLAKLINIQGKQQLNLGIEDCRGLTAQEFQKLDFSKMDLSEFIADIAPKDIPAGALRKKAKQSFEKEMEKKRSEQNPKPLIIARPRSSKGEPIYFEPREVLEEVLRTGQAQGILKGAADEAFSQQFNSNGVLNVKGQVLWRYRQKDCARLKVGFTKHDVDTPTGKTQAQLDIELNYCLDGSFPTDLSRK